VSTDGSSGVNRLCVAERVKQPMSSCHELFQNTDRTVRFSLGIVVPCFNEAEALPETTQKLLEVLDRLQAIGKVSKFSGIYYVDDGSRDETWSLIKRMAACDGRVRGIRLSKNMGHQNALLAGLFTVPGDGLISMDADLQDDINVVEKMVDEHLLRGMDVVYGVRNGRQCDTVFKRVTAEGFYWLMSMLGVDMIHNHADCRFLSRRAVEQLKNFRERNLFLRALVRLIGLPHSVVYYERGTRVAGTSKYPFRKMLAFALEAVTSFSAVPLRLIAWLGAAVFLLSIIMTAWAIYVRFFVNGVVPGWASIVLPVYFIGGIQIMCTGIIGEYLAKVYLETKQRPRFLIQETVEGDRDVHPRSNVSLGVGPTAESALSQGRDSAE
jgi:glycosyltransferase involved in cell wall biosynthesis